MSKAKKPWLSQEMTNINFVVYCGKPSVPYNQPTKFSFREKAPKSYCKLVTAAEPGPHKDTVHRFISTLIDRHDAEMFASRAWKCAVCNCRATKLCYTSMPNLAPPCKCHFDPSVRVYGIPACRGRNDRNCGREALAILDAYESELFPEHELNPLRCNRCNVKDGALGAVVKRCTGCKKASYCCKDHQRIDWPKHKADCKRVQKEESQPGYKEAMLWRKYALGLMG